MASTQAENVQNECVAGLFSTVDSAWNVYYYMDKYMATESEVHMAWGITYLVKGFEEAYSLDCSTFETDVNNWADDAANWFSGLVSSKAPRGSLEPVVN